MVSRKFKIQWLVFVALNTFVLDWAVLDNHLRETLGQLSLFGCLLGPLRLWEEHQYHFSLPISAIRDSLCGPGCLYILHPLLVDNLKTEGKKDKSAFLDSLSKQEMERCKCVLTLLFGESEEYKRKSSLFRGRTEGGRSSVGEHQ